MSAHQFSSLGARNGQRFLVVRYANELLHLHQRQQEQNACMPITLQFAT